MENEEEIRKNNTLKFEKLNAFLVLLGMVTDGDKLHFSILANGSSRIS